MSDSDGFDVQVERDGYVARVVFSAPPVNNISAALTAQLADAMEALDSDTDCRAVILASRGKVFCAGAALSADNAGADPAGGSLDLYDQAARLFRIKTPVIAEIQGAAIGAGLGLALTADFRIASHAAKFSANFVKLGFHPGFGMSRSLPHVVGPQIASRLFLTGARIKGDTALAYRLIDELVAPEALASSTMSFAQSVAENAPLAVRDTKQTLRGELAASIRDVMTEEAKIQSIHFKSDDVREGIAAVAARRPGQFKGR